MAATILITGGAGFIGSHLADRLLAAGHRVRVLDALCEQVHENRRRPDYLSPEVDLIEGDVRDPESVRRALEGVEQVVHLAASVGVGQSMYRIADYVSVNDHGTAVLLQALMEHPVQRLVVASSMSIYGEGLYRAADGALVADATRKPQDVAVGRFDPVDADGAPLEPLPTSESKPPVLASVYALNKYMQERLCLLYGQAYGVPVTALRFFNVYGTRQALSNPYTGVMAIFAARLLNGRPPRIFEDGLQQRDFVHVSDVARACELALQSPEAAGGVFNVGSGQRITVLDLARRLAAVMGREDIAPDVTGECRIGDIRHCFADPTLARDRLGFVPAMAMEDGLAELVDWLAGQGATDRVDEAARELRDRGLVGGMVA